MMLVLQGTVSHSWSGLEKNTEMVAHARWCRVSGFDGQMPVVGTGTNPTRGNTK